MFELYRDSHFVSRKPTREEVAEDIVPGPDHSVVYEIIDTTDSPEGILATRVAVLRSCSGWLAYDLSQTEPLPNESHVRSMLQTVQQPPHEPSAEWCWLNNCHLSECRSYPNCEPDCGHT